jgi:cyclic pyranopterin phosphate synthase
MAALTDRDAQRLVAAARDFGLDVLAEVHDEAELDRALRLGARLIGINNRDLRSFETRLDTTERLAPRVPPDRIVVSESGIGSPADVARVAAAGARAILVGESLMRQPDVTAATRALLAPAAARRGVRPMAGKGLSHLDPAGAANMVDVSDKAVTAREATAEGRVVMAAATLDHILRGDAKKGDVIGTARIAGIMAAKRTAELIPLCHPLPLSKVSVDIEPDRGLPGLLVTATARVSAATGVEMEALTAVSVACLTIYDMAKAVDRGMRIERVRLLAKSGGRSGTWRAAE